jgi:hypothetical protein
MGFSLKVVQLQEHGILSYDFLKTVDKALQVYGNGNYLVGLDYVFIKYPKGILKHNFTTTVLTKDKSMISIEGLYLGKLIKN